MKNKCINLINYLFFNIEYRTFTCETYLFFFLYAFRRGVRLRQQFETDWPVTVSYTHLDVYKRQICELPQFNFI